jgi:hypothetical protein
MSSSLVLTNLPEDLLWAIIAPVFGEQVLGAFNASYPKVVNYDSATTRPFVDEMTETLMFKNIFSLLHVSGKFREITGRLLLRAVPTTGPESE